MEHARLGYDRACDEACSAHAKERLQNDGESPVVAAASAEHDPRDDTRGDVSGVCPHACVVVEAKVTEYEDDGRCLGETYAGQEAASKHQCHEARCPGAHLEELAEVAPDEGVATVISVGDCGGRDIASSTNRRSTIRLTERRMAQLRAKRGLVEKQRRHQHQDPRHARAKEKSCESLGVCRPERWEERPNKPSEVVCLNDEARHQSPRLAREAQLGDLRRQRQQCPSATCVQND
mmetsp:Transcript_41030/g.112946  ORF Transcript_41030/g.112946 Transcript_41030/m.112946 type:complete len:235 (+) Transcript_41030:343-1047(+)